MLKSGFSHYIVNEFNCSVIVLTHAGCPPLFGYYKIYNVYQRKEPPKQRTCRQQVVQWEEHLKDNENEYTVTIFSSRWNWLVASNKYDKIFIREDALAPFDRYPLNLQIIDNEFRRAQLKSALQNTAAKLAQYKQKAIFISQPPVQLLDLRDYGNAYAFSKAQPLRSEALNRHYAFEKLLLGSGIIDGQEIFYFDVVSKMFCTDSEIKCVNRIENKSLYKDDDHISEFGSYKLAELLVKQLPQIISK